MDLRNLSTISVLSDAVTVCDYQGIKVVRVIHELAEAGISLHGGHLIWFKPAGSDDIIWLSEKAEFDTTKAIRGEYPSAGLGSAKQPLPLMALRALANGLCTSIVKTKKV